MIPKTETADPQPSGAQMEALFRREAIDFAGNRTYGTVVLTRPISYSLLTALFTAFTLGAIFFFFSFSYSRKAQLTGEVMPERGLLRITSNSSGIVTKISVHEGESVKEGEVVALVSNERGSEEGAGADETIAKLMHERVGSLMSDSQRRREQEVARSAFLERRISALQNEVGQFVQQIELQERRLEIARDAHTQTKSLRDSNFVSDAQVRDKIVDVLEQESKLRETVRSRSAALRELAEAGSDLENLRLQARRDDDQAIRSVNQAQQAITEHEAKRGFALTAPTGGAISTITVRKGQAISAGQTVAYLVPENSMLEVHLYVTPKDAAFIRPGAKAHIRYTSFSYQKYGQFGGSVIDVSGNTLIREDLTIAGATRVSSGDGDGLYRVRIALNSTTVTVDGIDQPIKPGMTVEASLILESRKLYEWVVAPLYAIKGRI